MRLPYATSFRLELGRQESLPPMAIGAIATDLKSRTTGRNDAVYDLIERHDQMSAVDSRF